MYHLTDAVSRDNTLEIFELIPSLVLSMMSIVILRLRLDIVDEKMFEIIYEIITYKF